MNEIYRRGLFIVIPLYHLLEKKKEVRLAESNLRSRSDSVALSHSEAWPLQSFDYDPSWCFKVQRQFRPTPRSLDLRQRLSHKPRYSELKNFQIKRKEVDFDSILEKDRVHARPVRVTIVFLKLAWIRPYRGRHVGYQLTRKKKSSSTKENKVARVGSACRIGSFLGLLVIQLTRIEMSHWTKQNRVFRIDNYSKKGMNKQPEARGEAKRLLRSAKIEDWGPVSFSLLVSGQSVSLYWRKRPIGRVRK